MEIVREVGSQGKLARMLGVNPTTVSYWVLVTGEIPAKHVIALEKASEGRFHRSYIRPDLYEY